MALFVPVTLGCDGIFGAANTRDSVTLNFWLVVAGTICCCFVFIGRLLCAVCPFMIRRTMVARASLLVIPRQQLPWPPKLAQSLGSGVSDYSAALW